MRIVFSGGGTGGHIFPAIAVAQELTARAPDTEVLFIGAKGKMEMTKVSKAGFDIKGLWISGFHRKLTIRNLLFPFKLIVSLISAYRILRSFKPDLVAGFGGYASGAAVYIASMLRIPTLIQEQNSYPGVTNKLLAKRVDKICTAYVGSQRFFPQEKTIVTGNPIRASIRARESKSKGIAHFKLDPGKKTILIVGGSLGAKSLNMGLRDQYEALKGLDNMQLTWQCGALYIDEYMSCPTAQLEHVHIMAFIDDMPLAYAAADVVISRAGALSVSELCAQSKAAILVPSPNVAEDHQTKNAQALVDQDAAMMIADAEFEEQFIKVSQALLNDNNRLKSLEANIAMMALPDAANHIADILMGLIDDD